MNTSAVFSVALRSLQRAPLRSALTAIGIIAGVAAIITTASIGAGASVKIQEALEKPETRTVRLTAFIPPSAGRPANANLSPSERLRSDDYDALRKNVVGASAITPQIYIPTARVQADGDTANAVLEALDVGGFVITPRLLLEGAIFSDSDVRNAANVCLLSDSLAQRLFGKKARIGRSISIQGTSFIVIGVVDDIANDGATLFSMQDLHVYAPYTSVLRRLGSTAPLMILMQAVDVESVRAMQANISDVMEQRRRGRKAVFLTINAVDSINAYAAGSLTVARLLAAVGAIALLVGGVGIMNIMLVSVTERMREVGIRSAIGTRSRDIRRQFLFEATVLSSIGGVTGVAVGWAASAIITRLNDWPTNVTSTSVLSALLCSIAVGLFFGFHPAQRAASLEPVQALRIE